MPPVQITDIAPAGVARWGRRPGRRLKAQMSFMGMWAHRRRRNAGPFAKVWRLITFSMVPVRKR
jgi:hypothetical protein